MSEAKFSLLSIIAVLISDGFRKRLIIDIGVEVEAFYQICRRHAGRTGSREEGRKAAMD